MYLAELLIGGATLQSGVVWNARLVDGILKIVAELDQAAYLRINLMLPFFLGLVARAVAAKPFDLDSDRRLRRLDDFDVFALFDFLFKLYGLLLVVIMGLIFDGGDMEDFQQPLLFNNLLQHDDPEGGQLRIFRLQGSIL